jgi:hypothetical protein
MFPICSNIAKCALKNKSGLFGFEIWEDNDYYIEELIALVTDHAVARAAFAEAVKRRPGKIIILRQKSRVLADSRR